MNTTVGLDTAARRSQVTQQHAYSAIDWRDACSPERTRFAGHACRGGKVTG